MLADSVVLHYSLTEVYLAWLTEPFKLCRALIVVPELDCFIDGCGRTREKQCIMGVGAL